MDLLKFLRQPGQRRDLKEDTTHLYADIDLEVTKSFLFFYF